MTVALPLVTVVGSAFLVIALGISIGILLHWVTPYLEQIPAIGGWLADHVEGLAQAISHACGKVLEPIGSVVGSCLHAVARAVDWTYGEFRSHAKLLFLTAALLESAVLALHGLRALVHRLDGPLHTVLHRFVAIGRELRGIEHGIRDLRREIAHGIGHDLRIHIKALEKWEEAAKAQLEADAKAIAVTIPASIASLRDFIGLKKLTTYAEWAAAIVTAALGVSVFRWLKCSEAENLANKRGCSAWGDLDDLLGLLAVGVIALEFDTLVHEAEGVMDVLAGGIEDAFGLGGG